MTDLLAFIEKFGCEPGPDAPVFFDPDADEPRELDLESYEKDLAEAMAAADIDPRLIYASRKTGLLITEENLDKLPLEKRNAAGRVKQEGWRESRRRGSARAYWPGGPRPRPEPTKRSLCGHPCGRRG